MDEEEIVHLLDEGVLVMPEQFFASAARLVSRSAPHRLALAILLDALLCVQRSQHSACKRIRQRGEEARSWFESQDDRWPFSFQNICGYLMLEPEAVRTAVRTAAGERRGECPVSEN